MSQINSNTKDEFQVVLLLSCFVGHPVFDILGTVISIAFFNFAGISVTKELSATTRYTQQTREVF